MCLTALVRRGTSLCLDGGVLGASLIPCDNARLIGTVVSASAIRAGFVCPKVSHRCVRIEHVVYLECQRHCSPLEPHWGEEAQQIEPEQSWRERGRMKSSFWNFSREMDGYVLGICIESAVQDCLGGVNCCELRIDLRIVHFPETS